MDLRSRQKSLMPLPTSLRDACDWDYATRMRQGEDSIRVFTVSSRLRNFPPVASAFRAVAVRRARQAQFLRVSRVKSVNGPHYSANIGARTR